MHKQSDQPSGLGSPPLIPPWSRRLAITAAVVFCISLVFPIAAALSRDTAAFPKWWGIVDVGLAFILMILAFAISVVAQGKVTRMAQEASYRAYRVLIHGIWILLVVFLLFGDRITWINGLPGIAWRAWLLFYSLPMWFTALGGAAGAGEASRQQG